MKGRTPTAAEKRYMDAVHDLGCYCCERLGVEPYPDGTLIHHVNGKTAPGAHYDVIPLCDIHHSRYSMIGLHYNPTAWEKEWGKQEAIVEKVRASIGGGCSVVNL